MPLDFPASPTNGQVFGSYVWSASKGVWQSREESAAVAIVSPTIPASANNGDIWYNSSRGIPYVYYDDGTSSQWVEILTSGTPELSTKANLAGGNTFSGTQTFNTPVAISSGGTGNSTGVNLIPTGAIMMWYTNTAPTGWLLCNGQSTSGYTALAAIVGANVPNLQGRVPVGRDTTQTEFDVLGETGGAKTHTLTISEMPSHTHIQDAHNHTKTQNMSDSGVNADVNYMPRVTGTIHTTQTFTTNSTTATNQNTGGGGAHNNLQPYTVVNYIIKT